MSEPIDQIKRMKLILGSFLFTCLLFLVMGCSTTIPIDGWREKYPGDDIRSVSETYNRGSKSEAEIKEMAMERVREIAQNEGMTFEVLEEELSSDRIQGPENDLNSTLVTLKIIFRLIDSAQ